MTTESVSPPASLRVLKGHGTENDFVVLPDLDAAASLSPGLVRALCDRHAGLGADGVLRVVRTSLATEPEVLAQAPDAEFFMDYHNADGSIAEMCGNGVRVFGRYLREAGLIDGPTRVATRGGTKTLSFDGDDVVVNMGAALVRPERPKVTVASELGGLGPFDSIAVDMPNPHVVVELESVEQLAALDLTRPPVVDPPLPEGQNVEFIVRTGPRELRMRVHERGSGETRSCGTGICAVVVAAADANASIGRWQVAVLGGRIDVWWTDEQDVMMSGPAVLVATADLTPEWLTANR